MNVIDLLPDHPVAPKWQSFEAFLPDLMGEAVSSLKAFVSGYIEDSSRYNTFERTSECFDVTITWIQYEVEMIGHENISDQLTWPVVQERGAHFKECFTAPIFIEDWNAVHNVAGNIMQSARKVEIGPLFSHEEACE